MEKGHAAPNLQAFPLCLHCVEILGQGHWPPPVLKWIQFIYFLTLLDVTFLEMLMT